ncbi:unnamed protein product [Ranitomeya imitator]|uniref:PDZ domain-containing protein n=1 Tax=Ranitomeya imitator TaxID=111125 RepID=A0ABN9LNG0_9NEOB|nr:unnamed protein product [Ranitomeya imitator]
MEASVKRLYRNMTLAATFKMDWRGERLSYSMENNKVLLTGRPGSISDVLTLDDDNGSVVVAGIKHSDPVASSLGLKEGDELLGATIYFDNLHKGEVLDILKATEPYKTSLQLHTKTETLPQVSAQSLRTDNVAVNTSAYDELFNSKIRRYLKGSVSMQDLSKPGIREGQYKPSMTDYKLSAFGSSSQISEIPYPDFNAPNVNQNHDVQIKAPRINAKGNFPGYQMPSVHVSGPKINAPNIEADLKAPSFNMRQNGVPDVAVDLRAPNVEFPNIEVDGRTKFPEMDLTTPSASAKWNSPDVNINPMNIKGPKFKAPSLNIFSSKKSDRDGDFNVPKLSGSLNVPDLDADLPNVQGPNLNVSLPKADMQGPKFKSPQVNVDLPKLRSPDMNMNVPKKLT